MNLNLREVKHFNELKNSGDFLFTDNNKVIMNCPVCNTVFFCVQEIVSRNPLTLSPSVLGPKEGLKIEMYRNPKEQVLGPCKHHFWVKDGIALEIE